MDFPEKNTFLTPEETAFVKERVERDRADSENDPLTWKKTFTYACDLKVWSESWLHDVKININISLFHCPGFGLMFMCTTMYVFCLYVAIYVLLTTILELPMLVSAHLFIFDRLLKYWNLF